VNQVVVTGIGLVSAFGTLEPTWNSLLAGKSGISIRQPFAELPPYPLAMLDDCPTTVNAIAQQVVQDALIDAGLSTLLPDCAIVIGSSRGNQSQWEQLLHADQKEKILPSAFLHTLPHSAAIAVAQLIQTHAAVRSPMAACAASDCWSGRSADYAANSSGL
jgi:3-oxoacyl-[acyl-carrier-protein] synthase II